MDKTSYFLSIFRKAEARYRPYTKRLAAEGWKEDWQILIATIMSAQSRDETTIPIAESLFKKYQTLKKLASAKYKDVVQVMKSLNYNKTKAKNVIGAAKMLVDKYCGEIPDNIDSLVELPGVGRKTANLVLSEVHAQSSITVDTHVHRISNVLGLVHTKTPGQTERELMKIAPREYWSRINRIFVLWGKEVRGRDKKKFIKKLQEH